MKTELILDEMKKAIKRLEKDNKLKTIICIGAGLAVVIVGIVFLVVKSAEKQQVMTELMRAVGTRTRSHGLILSMPVSDAIGLAD